MLKHVFIASILISGAAFGMNNQPKKFDAEQFLRNMDKRPIDPLLELHQLELTLIKQDPVNAFNNEYTNYQREKAVYFAINGKPEDRIISKLLATSLPTRKTDQLCVIMDLVGDNEKAHKIFKKMPSGNAVKRVTRRDVLRKKTEGRLSKSDAFLLSPKQHKLCNDIFKNAKKTTSNGKLVLEMDDKTYNEIAHLPPHVRAAVGYNIIAAVNKTHTEKIVNIGICTLGGCIGGTLAGGTIGALIQAPVDTVHALKNAAPFIANSAVNIFLQDTVTFDPEQFHDTMSNAGPEYDYHTHKKVKETIQIHDPKEAAIAAIEVAKNNTTTTLSQVQLVNYDNAKTGALYGAVMGGTLGFFYGALNNMWQPKKRVELTTMKNEKQ